MDSHEAFVALNLIEGIGPIRARSLVEFFGDAPAVLSASKSQLLQVRNIGAETADAICAWEKNVDLAGEMKRLADFGCRVLIQADENTRVTARNLRSTHGALCERFAIAKG
jgi:DNA processing protein